MRLPPIGCLFPHELPMVSATVARARSGMSDPLVWDPTDPAQIADPYPAYEILRRDYPAWHSPVGYWVLSRHVDIEAAMTDPRFISNDTSGGAKVAPPGPDVVWPTGK